MNDNKHLIPLGITIMGCRLYAEIEVHDINFPSWEAKVMQLNSWFKNAVGYLNLHVPTPTREGK